MSKMSELTDTEVDELMEDIVGRINELLPNETVFILILGDRKQHRATLANIPPERLADVLRQGMESAQRDFIENN